MGWAAIFQLRKDRQPSPAVSHTSCTQAELWRRREGERLTLGECGREESGHRSQRKPGKGEALDMGGGRFEVQVRSDSQPPWKETASMVVVGGTIQEAH